MYFIKTPWLIKAVFSKSIWNFSRKQKTIFLTFDDGPNPNVTTKILEILGKYNAKATFFCLGKNIMQYPALFQQLAHEGHHIGNHTFNHLKGWETPIDDYLSDIEKCAEITHSSLFRPPYGKATRKQLQQVYPKFKVIMWDIMPGDFDANVSPEKCFSNMDKYMENGSIIVLHDNDKARENVLFALPQILEKYSKKGFSFLPIPY